VKKILFFMLVSVNGYYERGKWGLDWHNVDEEFSAFALEQLESVDTLVLGRATYEGFAAYWPTAEAIADAPAIAEKMNGLPKVVFSNSLDRAEWSNTRVVSGEPGAMAEEIERLRREPGKDTIVFGSSDLAASLSEHGLIDEYRIMVNPIALADGKPLFEGMKADLPLKLLRARTFESGNVLLYYERARGGQI
jgi:dihydrofolate reductase